MTTFTYNHMKEQGLAFPKKYQPNAIVILTNWESSQTPILSNYLTTIFLPFTIYSPFASMRETRRPVIS